MTKTSSYGAGASGVGPVGPGGASGLIIHYALAQTWASLCMGNYGKTAPKSLEFDFPHI